MTRILLNGHGVRELLKSAQVASDIQRRARAVEAAAKAAAPVDSGAYRDSIKVIMEMRADRIVAHVSSDVEYAMRVEAIHGTLARALDAAR